MMPTDVDRPEDRDGLLRRIARHTDLGHAARTADLSIGACRVRLYRPAKRNKRYFHPPRALDVNMVVIRETQPPDGATPVQWVLFTSHPIQTLADLGKVAIFYELRWLIEEFFTLLQSAYRIEGSHLTDAAKIARRLVLLTLAATSVLQIQSTLGLPAKGPLPAADYERVKIAITQLHNPNLDPNLRFFALLANLGGWLARRNDPIGPTILMRGLLTVLVIADALRRFGPTLDTLLASLPQLLASIIRV